MILLMSLFLSLWLSVRGFALSLCMVDSSRTSLILSVCLYLPIFAVVLNFLVFLCLAVPACVCLIFVLFVRPSFVVESL